MKPEVFIVGGGLAGLACAMTLNDHGIQNVVLEGGDRVGGRVQTDNIDGFLLDRGFQVFSPGYPEAKRFLDYHALRLQSFHPGALVRFAGKFHRLSDPFRQPFQALLSLTTPIGTMADKFRMAQVRQRALSGSLQEIFQRRETSTLQYLQELQFSQSMINRFFRPFLGGVFLDPELKTSSRLAEFVVRMFSSSSTSLPAEGMGAISQQMASRLQPGQIRTRSRVTAIQEDHLILESHERLDSKAIVLATNSSEAGQLVPELTSPKCHSVACVYYAASEPPIRGPYLILNGEGSGPINNLCVLTQIAPSYAPSNQQLLSISVLNPDPHSEMAIEHDVRLHLNEWFGSQVNHWRHLQTSIIQEAQPIQEPPTSSPYSSGSRLAKGVFICGDYRTTATIDGALLSGRRAAEEVVQEFRPFEPLSK